MSLINPKTVSGAVHIAATDASFAAPTNQLVFGTGINLTVDVNIPAASQTYSIIDVGANADFVMTGGTQTITGQKNFDIVCANQVNIGTTTPAIGVLFYTKGKGRITDTLQVDGGVLTTSIEPDTGTTINIGTITAGTTTNVNNLYAAADAHIVGNLTCDATVQTVNLNVSSIYEYTAGLGISVSGDINSSYAINADTFTAGTSISTDAIGARATTAIAVSSDVDLGGKSLLNPGAITASDRLTISTNLNGIDLLPASNLIYCSTATIQAGQINLNKIVVANAESGGTGPISFNSTIAPKTTGAVDIGTSALTFSNGYIDTINSTTGNITTVSSTTVGATTGNITTVNATTVNATTGKFDSSAAASGYPLTLVGRLTGGNDLQLSFQDSSKVAQWHMQLNNGSLEFTEDGVADGRLFLEAGGNVGINTRNPSYNLDVVGNAKISSTLVAGNGIQFTNSTSGYVAGTLNYFEGPTNVSITFTGAWASTLTWVFQRIGNLVICRFPDMTGTSIASDTIRNNTAGIIPARFRPAAVFRGLVIGMDAGVNTSIPLGADIDTAGNITFYKNASSTKFTSGAVCGPYGSCWQWSTA